MIPTRRGLGALAMLLAVGLALILGVMLGRQISRQRSERVDSAPVVQAIRNIAKLATVEIEIADVVRYEEVRRVVLFDVPKNATLRLRGKVTGGFDLKKGFTILPDPGSRTVKITLPPPEILAIDDRLEWFDEKSGWLNPITPADRTRWTAWARGSLGRAAKDAGLFEKSLGHARQLLTDAAAAFGWKAQIQVAATPIPTPQPRVAP